MVQGMWTTRNGGLHGLKSRIEVLFGGLHSKDNSILGSILGQPIYGNVPAPCGEASIDPKP